MDCRVKPGNDSAFVSPLCCPSYDARSNRHTWNSIRIKLARRIVQARRLGVEGAGAFVFAFALRQRRAAMPAGPRRHRRRFAALLIASEIDDVASSGYDFLNHYCPRGVRQCYDRKGSLKRSAQRSNFTGEIEAPMRCPVLNARRSFLTSSCFARRA